jgi:hypothetical protein
MTAIKADLPIKKQPRKGLLDVEGNQLILARIVFDRSSSFSAGNEEQVGVKMIEFNHDHSRHAKPDRGKNWSGGEELHHGG